MTETEKIKSYSKLYEVLKKLPGLIVTKCSPGDDTDPINIFLSLKKGKSNQSHLGLAFLGKLLSGKDGKYVSKNWSISVDKIDKIFKGSQILISGPVGDYKTMEDLSKDLDKIVEKYNADINNKALQIGDVVKILKLPNESDYERQSVFTGTHYSSFVGQKGPIIEIHQISTGEFSYTVGIANEASIHSFPRDCLEKVGVNEEIRQEWINREEI